MRQSGRAEGVDHQSDDQFLGGQGEDRSKHRGIGDPATGHDVKHEQHEAEDSGFDDAARTQEALVATHDQCDRNGHADGEHGPRRGGHGLDGHKGEERHGDGGHDDQEDRQHHATELAHLVGHLAEGTAAALGGNPQHEHVLHGTGEDHAENDPQHGRQITHLSGQNRADERARAGNAGEVLSEKYAAIGAFEVGAIMHTLGRGGVRVIGAHDSNLNVIRIETVCDGIGADGHDHEPDGADLLATGHGQNGPANGAHNGNGGPQQGLRPSPYHLRLHADR